ncbi:hypothetical protein L1281_000255 [Neisseria sp. HSC-16F19]|nr:hypothetical protein [Neisseria sp. HSC-16F19]MCP2039685.1 hypothetical protein [Neisseria sp. HSC-16F19]
MWSNPTLWVLAAYIGFFVSQTLLRRQWLWLGGAVLLWWLGALYSGRLLPGIFGTHKIANLYVPYLYITLASAWPLLTGWRRSGDGKGRCLKTGSVYLSLLAVSGLVQHLAFGALVLLTAYHYPGGVSLYVWPNLLQQYLLQPTVWIVSQWLLMALFYLHRQLLGQEADRFSLLQLQSGFLLMLVWPAWLLFADLAAFVAR